MHDDAAALPRRHDAVDCPPQVLVPRGGEEVEGGRELREPRRVEGGARDRLPVPLLPLLLLLLLLLVLVPLLLLLLLLMLLLLFLLMLSVVPSVLCEWL